MSRRSLLHNPGSLLDRADFPAVDAALLETDVHRRTRRKLADVTPVEIFRVAARSRWNQKVKNGRDGQGNSDERAEEVDRGQVKSAARCAVSFRGGALSWDWVRHRDRTLSYKIEFPQWRRLSILGACFVMQWSDGSRGRRGQVARPARRAGSGGGYATAPSRYIQPTRGSRRR